MYRRVAVEPRELFLGIMASISLNKLYGSIETVFALDMRKHLFVSDCIQGVKGSAVVDLYSLLV